MNKLNSWLIILIGIILVIPLVTDKLGSITEGALGWVLAIVVLIVGIAQLMKK